MAFWGSLGILVAVVLQEEGKGEPGGLKACMEGLGTAKGLPTTIKPSKKQLDKGSLGQNS